MNVPDVRLLQSAHTIDIVARKDGKDYYLEGDWIKALLARGTWKCSHCGRVEPIEREVKCWHCGLGEMRHGRH